MDERNLSTCAPTVAYSPKAPGERPASPGNNGGMRFDELFQTIPLEIAMPELCPSEPNHKGIGIVSRLQNDISPELAAGLWLYVDDLHRSHEISQSIDNATGAYWHAIMHRREGDFWNSGYWLRRCENHPAMHGYDPNEFLQQVEKHHKSNPHELLQMQRREWQSLFDWCLSQEKY